MIGNQKKKNRGSQKKHREGGEIFIEGLTNF